MYDRVDGGNDKNEDDEVVIDRAVSGHRVAFTVPTPLWGSAYGLAWKWYYPSPPEEYPSAAVFTGFRAQLEAEACEVRSRGNSSLRSALDRLLRQELLQTENAELEVTLYILTRAADHHPGKLVQMAWNQAVERSGGQGLELNFGAGVAGRAASLQRSIAWAACDRPDTLADFYLPTAGDLAHTGIVAIPIPERQPYAVLSVASRRHDLFSSGIREILESGSKKGTPASNEFSDMLARTYDLADHVERELKNAESGFAGGEPSIPVGKETERYPQPSIGAQEDIVATAATQPEIIMSGDALCPVDPDDVQRRLRQFEIDPRRK